MIEPGAYRTKGGLKAKVSESNQYGAIGWVYEAPGLMTPASWNINGEDFGEIKSFDLDIPRTIIIPESKLPEPYKGFVYKHNLTTSEKIKTEFVLIHNSREAAEAWTQWWRENICKGE